MRWFDPLTTLWGGTINSVFGMIFLVFAIPENLELEVEEFLHVLQRNVVFCTTARWHMGRISHGHLEYTLETVVTHAVSAA